MLIKRILCWLVVLFTQTASAEGWECWQLASERYQVPVELLYAIAQVETGNNATRVSRANKNGTYDIGLMQINSMHLPRLAAYGITEQQLREDACTNLHVGAWILSQNIARYGYTWNAVGAYNASSLHKRKIYIDKVLKKLNTQAY